MWGVEWVGLGDKAVLGWFDALDRQACPMPLVEWPSQWLTLVGRLGPHERHHFPAAALDADLVDLVGWIGSEGHYIQPCLNAADAALRNTPPRGGMRDQGSINHHPSDGWMLGGASETTEQARTFWPGLTAMASLSTVPRMGRGSGKRSDQRW